MGLVESGVSGLFRLGGVAARVPVHLAHGASDVARSGCVLTAAATYTSTGIAVGSVEAIFYICNPCNWRSSQTQIPEALADQAPPDPTLPALPALTTAAVPPSTSYTAVQCCQHLPAVLPETPCQPQPDAENRITMSPADAHPGTQASTQGQTAPVSTTLSLPALTSSTPPLPATSTAAGHCRKLPADLAHTPRQTQPAADSWTTLRPAARPAAEKGTTISPADMLTSTDASSQGPAAPAGDSERILLIPASHGSSTATTAIWAAAASPSGAPAASPRSTSSASASHTLQGVLLQGVAHVVPASPASATTAPFRAQLVLPEDNFNQSLATDAQAACACTEASPRRPGLLQRTVVAASAHAAAAPAVEPALAMPACHVPHEPHVDTPSALLTEALPAVPLPAAPAEVQSLKPSAKASHAASDLGARISFFNKLGSCNRPAAVLAQSANRGTKVRPAVKWGAAPAAADDTAPSDLAWACKPAAFTKPTFYLRAQ